MFCTQRTWPDQITNGTLPLLKYIWQALTPFCSPHSLSGGTGSEMPREGKPRWPHTPTNRDVLWGPETRSGDKELWRNESDSGSIHACDQDEEEMELEKSHGIIWGMSPGDEVWGPLRRQGWRTGSCGVIGAGTWVQDWGEKGLPHHGSEQIGVLSDGQGHSGEQIPYVLGRKPSCFPKVVSATAKWQWQCHCVLSTVFSVWPTEGTMSPFSFPDLGLPLRWRLHMLERLALRQTTSHTDQFPFLPQTLIFFVFRLLKKQ